MLTIALDDDETDLTASSHEPEHLTEEVIVPGKK